MAIVATGVLTAAARPRPILPPARVIRLKLEQFGWQRPLPPKPGEIDSLESQTITIDTGGRVLVGFTTRGPSEGLLRRSHPGLVFHILRFTGGGQPDLSLELPTNNWLGNGVYVDSHDRIIARADDKVQLLTSSSSDSAQVHWETLAACPRLCQVLQSPSRRTFYLYTENADPPVTVLNVDDLAGIRHCSVPIGFSPRSITDDFAYFNYDHGNPPFPPPVMYRWPLCDYGQRVRLPIVVHGLVYAISDDSLLLGDTIYSPDGKEKQSCSFLKVFNKHEGGGPRDMAGNWGISEGGHRIAIIAETQRGGSLLFDITARLTAQRIIPYNMATCQPLASIPMSPPSYFLRIAMAPDGHRVAALMRDTLTISDVP